MSQTFYTGIVENRKDDPLKLGRCQVRVFGVHTESLEDVPTASLPWAISLMPATSASMSGIGNSGIGYLEGTMVFVFFLDGESKQQPIIIGSVPVIPLSKDPLDGLVEYFELFKQTETGTSSQTESSTAFNKPGGSSMSQTSTVSSTASGTIVDSSGQPVVDGSGNPIKTEGAPDPTTPGLDISKMVAKYGPNVTTLYNTLKDFGIKDNYAIVAILSNVAKESQFKPVRERMNYSSVARLKSIFPSKFSSMSDADAQVYVNNEEKLANLVYSNSDGNGDVASGDGWKYRGGGFIQLTKKGNYSTVGKAIGVDLVGNPDLILTPEVSSKAVAQYFISRFGGASRLTFNSLSEALAAVTKKVNPGGFANDLPKVTTASTLCVINADVPGTPDAAAANEKKAAAAEANNPASPENDVAPGATQEEIDAGGISKYSKAMGVLGFKDASGKYPLSAFLKEPDSSRLSRRVTDNTLIDKKTKNRRTGIRSVSDTFSEPDTAYNASYPYNHVYATESGHALEFDDTPGNERINNFHTSGTYTETDKYGTTTNKIVGDSFTIIERNGYIYIDGTARITVGSDVKLVVEGNCDIAIDGNLNYDVGGTVTWKIGGSSMIGIGGVNSVRSGSSCDIDAPIINLNSGTSVNIPVSARSGATNDYGLQIPENYKGANSLIIEGSEEVLMEEFYKQEIAKGNMTQKQLDDGKAQAAAKPLAKDETAPPETTTPPLPESCAAFAGKTDIPDTTQLSKSFSLGMLSTRAVVSHYKVVDQRGLKTAEIVCNLKNLAENCLDPIKIKYPNMKVTSAFRVGSGTSQHELGQAADMQFDGVSKSDYYDIAMWIKSNILFDQLLLEYKTTGTGLPWIHISYKSSGVRKQVMTFMNDRRVNDGLQKLQA